MSERFQAAEVGEEWQGFATLAKNAERAGLTVLQAELMRLRGMGLGWHAIVTRTAAPGLNKKNVRLAGKRAVEKLERVDPAWARMVLEGFANQQTRKQNGVRAVQSARMTTADDLQRAY